MKGIGRPCRYKSLESGRIGVGMNHEEAFRVLGIDCTKDERAIKGAYREKLAVTNPEDDQEGFKRLRGAYEDACRYAREEDVPEESAEEKPRDTTPSGLWVEKAARIYGNIKSRQDEELWKALFSEDVFLSLEEEENCRLKLLVFLMEHYKLPTDIWKLLDRKLSIVSDADALREKLPPNFMRYCIDRCERGEDVEFGQFEGPEDGDYDLFLQYYDRCWQALQEKKMQEAGEYLRSADELGIRHPVMEVCRAKFLLEQGDGEGAVALLEEQCARYPRDPMLCYNTAEMLWSRGEGPESRKRAAEIFLMLKEDNDTHYMSNIRLTEWYYSLKQYREAKKCAEKVLASGCDDTFMGLLRQVNGEIERELEDKFRKTGSWEAALELCWCYLQDGKITRGICLARKLEELLPPEKDAEYKGLLAKLYVEHAEYGESIAMAKRWETALEEKMASGGQEDKRDRDRLRQVHLIRMQCYHNLGYKDREYFKLAIREGEGVLTGGVSDVNILMELALMYTEIEEYEKSLEISRRLVEEFQVFAAFASSMEAYRRQLNAGGVVRTAGQCIRYFPNFIKAYEYLAKVYLDFERPEDLAKVMGDAEKNGVKSVMLDAYRYQIDHEPMETADLNARLKAFRKDYLRVVEEGGIEVYEKGLEILTEYFYHYPGDYMLVERAVFHRAAHHYKEAREDFEKAIYINPSNPYALNGLSFVYKYLGDFEKALFYIKKAILYMDEEMSNVIYVDMGRLYSLLGDRESALDAYRQYEKMTGDSVGRHFGDEMAECAMRVGRIQEAEEIYRRIYEKDKRTCYERLVCLYQNAGRGDMAWQILGDWGKALHLDAFPASTARRLRAFLRNSVNPSDGTRQVLDAYGAYYNGSGWTQLLFGGKKKAARDFWLSAGCVRAGNGREGRICDAVFAFILCGEDEKGKKYAAWLKDWLEKEKSSSRHGYYNRRKGHLQMEFLAAYYTETPEKLREILDREKGCEICHFCTSPLCKEMEGVRILFLMREGRTEEARERLVRNLETQPWDEYMLAIRHVAFGDDL